MIWVQKGLKITPTQNNIKPYTSALLTLIPKVQYVLSELKQKKKKKIAKHTKNARKKFEDTKQMEITPK